MSNDRSKDPADVSRRDFLRGLGTGIAASAATGLAATGVAEPAAAEAAPSQDALPPATGRRLRGVVRVTLKVNGEERTADVEPRTTLLNTLRDHLDLTGAKKICDRGSCGGCTVMLDGRTVYSCMMLAVDAQGKKITTVEGLGSPEKMHPVQAAFVEHDALMCGFCTPGFVVSCAALLEHNPNPTREQVKAACSGNVCRCGTYPRVFEAALAAAQAMHAGIDLIHPASAAVGGSLAAAQAMHAGIDARRMTDDGRSATTSPQIQNRKSKIENATGGA